MSRFLGIVYEQHVPTSVDYPRFLDKCHFPMSELGEAQNTRTSGKNALEEIQAQELDSTTLVRYAWQRRDRPI